MYVGFSPHNRHQAHTASPAVLTKQARNAHGTCLHLPELFYRKCKGFFCDGVPSDSSRESMTIFYDILTLMGGKEGASCKHFKDNCWSLGMQLICILTAVTKRALALFCQYFYLEKEWDSLFKNGIYKIDDP